MEGKILESIKEPLEKENIKVYDISFIKEDGVDTLLIRLDGEVDTDLCEKASNIINPILDELDLINGEYVLDVCSKGEDDE